MSGVRSTRVARPGMTLVEMLLALGIFTILMTGALSLLRGQVRAFTVGTDRMSLAQNFRYAANVLEKDLRTVGSGVPAIQPFLVYAGQDVVAFNADYTSNVAEVVGAVYTDTTAPNALASALPRTRRFALPGTSFTYPDTTYRVAGTNSPAETILFFFAPDGTTSRADDYVLFRQVNDAAPEVVARNLLQTAGRPFFEYHRIFAVTGGTLRLDTVPQAALPLAHTAELHLSAADAGGAAVIDSIRAVRVSFTATNGRTGADERTGSISRLIRLPNAGKAQLQTCGDQPILGITLARQIVTVASTGEEAVELRWLPATDETEGERDVIRYVLWRRLESETEWTDPFLSIPAGEVEYSYLDTRVTHGESYVYALAAQDCTPSLSDLTVTDVVTIPSH